MFDALANFSPLVYAVQYEPLIAMQGPNTREDNVVKYIGVFGPVSAEVHYTFGAGVGNLGPTALASGGNGEFAGHAKDDSGYGAALTYASGPFAAVVAYDQWNPAVTIGNPGSAKRAASALSYTIGPAKLMGGYRWASTKDGNDLTLLRDDYFWAGVNYQVTPAFNFILEYVYDNVKTQCVNSAAAPFNSPNPWQVNLMLDYTLSKRTDIYFSTAFAKNASLALDSTATNYAYGYYLEQGKNNQFGATVGLRHKF